MTYLALCLKYIQVWELHHTRMVKKRALITADTSITNSPNSPSPHAAFRASL